MTQRLSSHAPSRPLFVRASVVALLMAGCGGSSGSGAREGGAEAPAREQQNASEPAGIEPAAETPALNTPAAPLPGAIDTAPDGLAPEATPLPTEVQVTNDSVQLGASAGLPASPLFVARSPLGTTLEVVEANERICLRGGLSAVPDGDYPNYWGGEVGLVLGSSPPEDVAAAGEGVQASAFSFRLSGALLPQQLRLRVAAAGEVPLTSQYCENVPTDTLGTVEVALQSLTFECWAFDGAPYPGNASATLLSWQLPANSETASQFDFCIEDIRAVQ